MASVTYSSGTVIPVAWLNDVNSLIYGKATDTGNPIRVDLSGNVGIGVIPAPTAGLSVKKAAGNNVGVEVTSGATESISFGYNDSGSTNLWGAPTGTNYIGAAFTHPIIFAIAASEKMRLDTSGSLLMTGATSALGYGTGSGGTVTQLTSKATAVTLNKASGTIIMNNAALASGASVSFVCNNSLYNNNGDTITYILSGATSSTGNYQVYIFGGASGSFTIKLTNITGGSLSDNININFNIIKGSIT